MPKNPLIDLLRAYGPTSEGDAMYDEFVLAEAQRADLSPLKIEEFVSGRISDILRSEMPHSFILTGTAGDGKTYTARKAFAKLEVGEWDPGAISNEANLPSGRRVHFLKDLSELNGTQRTEWYPRLAAALVGESEEVFVVCVNDGQLLAFFREQRGTARGREFLDLLTRMLRGEATSEAGYEFEILHMSRRSHAETLGRIFETVLEHEAWERCPEDCPALAGPNICPIRGNRSAMDLRFRARVRDAVELAAADGRHLSLRQLIILVINALLGDAKGSATRLMTCGRAQNIAAKGDYAWANPYANVLGHNHSERARSDIVAFATLARLGIGEETTNAFDNALLDEMSAGALPASDLHGERIFAGVRAEYADDPSGTAKRINEALRAQRQRLFFSLDEGGPLDPWRLTRFHGGRAFLDLVNDLKDGMPARPETRRQITLGLNRTMTGYLTTSAGKIWMTQSAAPSHGRGVPLLIDSPVPWTGRRATARIRKQDGASRPPVVEIVEDRKVFGALELTPTMFEFLSRVAEGALPASFGSQCLQEIRAFQIRVTGSIARESEDAKVGMQLQEIGLQDDGELVEREIKMLEDAFGESPA